MRPVRISQTSFTAGELAPTVAARIEVARYYAGAERMENLLVRPQGGARRRPGMRHVATLTDADNGLLRLIPFSFNIEQTYLIVLTAGTLRVYRADGAPLAGLTGCPWTAAQAAQINWAQSADTLLLTHPDMPMQQIRRGTVETIWTRAPVTLSNIPTFDFGSGPEPMVSAARGWPECLTFHRGRLWLAGLKARPATVLASRIADFFNFDIGTGLDDQAIAATIDTDQVNAIHQLQSGRALQIFTAGAEHIIDGELVTPKTIAVAEQTRRGIQRFSRVAEVDGASMFVQRGGAALRQFVFADVEQAWRSDLSSLLAPHLIQQPREPTVRKGVQQDDADHVLLPNGTAMMAVLTTLRAQEVTAFTRWTTAGEILAACPLPSGEVYFATRRAGQTRIERWSEASLLDASYGFGPAPPFTVVPNLTHLEGMTVALVADGVYLGTATVADGQVTLPRPALFCEVGLPFTPRLVTMPLEPRDPTGALIGRRARITEISARVNATGYLLVQGQPVILRRLGGPPNAALDTPPPVETGDVTLRGLAGWRERPQVEISQPVPGPLEVLAIATRLELAA
jgi:hypothetical protein